MNFENLSELEEQAKLTAVRAIADTFQKYESLDKVSQYIKRYKSQEEATEAQLKITIQTQLDNVKDGLEKLDSCYEECKKIQDRMEEISAKSLNIKALSHGLEDLQSQTKQQQQLAAAMDNMEYLVNVPERIKHAKDLLESSNFLHAHKIIEELEGTRDEIMNELYRQQSSEADLNVIETFFMEVDKLNQKMLIHIKLMGERFINACVTNNKVLVNCIRIIDREERTDELWAKNKDSSKPIGRPKKWKEEFFNKIELYIREKIFESALDEEADKSFLPRHLEAIRQHTMADLKIVKVLGVLYFPPRYEVYEEFIRLFHKYICEYVQNKAKNITDEREPFQLLGWINQYYSKEFMGSPELDIDFSKVKLMNPYLLTHEEYETLATKYLDRERVRLQSWFSNSIRSDKDDWMSSELPPLDGESCYHTQLSIVIFKPLTEIIGPDKVLHHLGERIREKFYPMYLYEFIEFQKEFEKELINYKNLPIRDNEITNKIEYLVANCNNCLRLDTTLTEMITNDLKDSSFLRTNVDSMMKEISAMNFRIAQLCLDFIIESLLMDLAVIFSKILSENWISQDFRVVDYILGTFVDYDNTFIYLKHMARIRLVKAIIQKIVIEYIKVLLSRNINLSPNDRKKVGNNLYYEGDKLIDFFRGKMNLDPKCLECVEALKLIAQLILNSDKSMIRLDIETLMNKFPDIRKDQMTAILMLRGDMKLGDAKEIANDLSYSNPDERHNLFNEVAKAMNRA